MGYKPRAGKKKGIPLSEVFYGPATGLLVAEQWFPLIDVCETDTGVIIRIEVPGVHEHDLRVTIHNGSMKVEGLKREPEFPDDEKIRFICLERGYGPFQKIIELQWVVDPKKAVAELKNGVLCITLPKLADRRGAQFEIPVQAVPDE